jgi:transcriptional regulator with XRE-family HTH domain
MKGGFTHGTVPNDVVNLSFERGVSPMAAWREHFGLTQAEVAARIGITQAAYAQMERVKRPRKATLAKVASATGLEAEQLRW